MSIRVPADLLARVDERVAAHHAAVEAACEAALQGGEHGVMVQWNETITVASVDPDVPYGCIHEHWNPHLEETQHGER